MRALCLALLLTALSGAADGDAAADAADDDLDLGDDLDEDADLEADFADAEADAAPDMPPVEDFDLGMSDSQRKAWLRVCYVHTVNRAQARRQELNHAVKEMMASAEARAQQMSEEKTLTTLVFSWMMQCYMNIDDATAQEGAILGSFKEELERALFAPRADRPQQVQQASSRQWELVSSVMAEEQQKMQQQGRPGGGSPEGAAPGIGLVGAGLSGQSQALYIGAVFTVIFGLGAITVLRLSRSEKATERSGSSKSQKKAEKAEKKLARKRM